MYSRSVEPGTLKGAPIRPRLRNFRPDAGADARAIAGPPVWMRRIRAIEDATAEHERRLGEAWESLAEDAAAWRELAARWSFADVNALIEQHNRCYPIEARLAMDPRTRDYVRVSGRSYEREPLDTGWILERFPPR
jgi:hypothetical protein